MSLLLEALKKAEKAKEEAQRRAKGDAAPASTAEIRLEAAEPAPAEKPVMTRAELPDIRQPLEILSDEIAPRQPEPAPRVETAAASAAERAAARKVFEAKFKEPNPRLPFYITMGLLGVFAVGTAGYFWYQLRPPAPLVNANPAPRARRAGRRARAQARGAGRARGRARPDSRLARGRAARARNTGGQAGIRSRQPRPGRRPNRGSRRRGRPDRVRPPHPRPRPASRRTCTRRSKRRTPPTSPETWPPRAPITRRRCATKAATATRCSESLRSTCAPGASSRRRAIYLRLLQADPSDAHAQAALIALRASRLDPLATESRVKTLLAADPDAEALHFTLGNRSPSRGAGPRRRQRTSRPSPPTPTTPTSRYNLAVSLDHLRQSKPALEYYRRAIALAEKRSASFDVAAARNRRRGARQIG